MRIKTRLVLVHSLLLLLFLAPPLAGVGFTQSPAPLEALNIALWPEYDRPEVLVIFSGKVAEDVPLPASLSFTLPASVQGLNAVAYLDEAQGGLLNVPEFEFVEGNDGKVLSFTSPSRQFQFEYYSNDLLSTDGAVRDLSYSFTPSADVAVLTLEMQQPSSAQAFTSDPPPSATQDRQDGLTYALYEMGAVPAGESRSLEASYTRSTDRLSLDAVAGVNIPSSPEQTQVVSGGGGLRDSLGPILIAVGVLLLTGSLIYWFWSQRAVVVPEPASRRSSARPRRSSRKSKSQSGASQSTAQPAKNDTLAAYCHRCGTKFRDDAMFCHACGAERRAD